MNDLLQGTLDVLRMRDRPAYEILKEPATRSSFETHRQSLSPAALEIVRAGLRQSLSQEPHLLLLAGPGHPAELQIAAECAMAAPVTPILVVSPDPERILQAFAEVDLRPSVESGIFCWALGEPIAGAMAEAVERHALFLVGDDRIRVHFGLDAADEKPRTQYLEAIQTLAGRMEPWRVEMSEQTERYVTRVSQAPGRPSHVWSSGASSNYSSTPILNALHRGLQSEGLQATFTTVSGGRTNRFIQHRGLAAAAPDTLLFTNSPTYLHVPEGHFHRLVWVTDDPALRPFQNLVPRYGPDEWVAYADRSFEAALIEQGAERRFHLPAFAVVDREGETVESLQHPIVYVGMIQNLKPMLDRMDLSDRMLLTELAEETLRSGTVDAAVSWSDRPAPESLLAAAQEICARAGRTFQDPQLSVCYAAYMLAAFRRRWEVVRALLPMGLHVYGGADWLPLLGDRYADRYHGVVDYNRLPDLYRSAQVVINIHSAQCPTCLNVRDYDALMAGACLLTDPVAEMSETTLLPDRDLAIARIPEEFAASAAALLADAGKRRDLADRGGATVRERHLPAHRARTLLDNLA